MTGKISICIILLILHFYFFPRRIQHTWQACFDGIWMTWQHGDTGVMRQASCVLRQAGTCYTHLWVNPCRVKIKTNRLTFQFSKRVKLRIRENEAPIFDVQKLRSLYILVFRLIIGWSNLYWRMVSLVLRSLHHKRRRNRWNEPDRATGTEPRARARGSNVT